MLFLCLRSTILSKKFRLSFTSMAICRAGLHAIHLTSSWRRMRILSLSSLREWETGTVKTGTSGSDGTQASTLTTHHKSRPSSAGKAHSQCVLIAAMLKLSARGAHSPHASTMCTLSSNSLKNCKESTILTKKESLQRERATVEIWFITWPDTHQNLQELFCQSTAHLAWAKPKSPRSLAMFQFCCCMIDRTLLFLLPAVPKKTDTSTNH